MDIFYDFFPDKCLALTALMRLLVRINCFRIDISHEVFFIPYLIDFHLSLHNFVTLVGIVQIHILRMGTWHSLHLILYALLKLFSRYLILFSPVAVEFNPFQ